MKRLFAIAACAVALASQAIEPGHTFPKMPQAETTVFVACGGSTESAESQIACRIFQGIINREKAELFLSTGDKEMDWWKYIDVAWTRPAKGVITTGENRGLRTLFKSYADRLDRLVVCNYANNDYTFNMGLLMACAGNDLPVTEALKDALVAEFGWDKEIVDIRDRWPDITQAYNWALDEIMPRINKQLVVSAGLRDDWRGGGWRIFDYAVASRSFTFWVDDKTTTGKNIIKKILRTPGYPANAVVMGYGMHGDDLNDTTNPEGFGYVVGDLFPNASYYSSFPTETFENWQREGEAVEAKPGKIYVSLYWSDGDNISFNHNLEHIIWSQAERGKVPVSMTVAPALCELAPFILRYYHETATDNDELIGGPSGAQYIQEPFYKPSQYYSWCGTNGEFMRMGGLRSTCSSLRFPVQPFYNNGFVKTALTGTIAWSNGAYYDAYDWCGMPVVCGGGVCGDTDGIYNYLKGLAVNGRMPLFTGVYMVQAGLSGQGYAGINKVVERLQAEFPDRFEFMRASDMLATAAKYFADRRKPFRDISIPGRVEAEDFDLGGQGAGFWNSARSNKGGAYRTDAETLVGIGEGASGHHVGWTNSGEWLNYTVDIDAAGTYLMTLRYATAAGQDKSVCVMLDHEVLASITLPATGGSTDYADAMAYVNLPEGIHSLRMMINNAGLDLDYYDFAPCTVDALPEIEPGSLYRITAVHSGKALSLKTDNTTAGTRIVQRDFNGAPSQLWHIDVAGAGCHSLRNHSSGMSIMLRGSSTVGQFDFDCTADLGKWNLRYAGDGNYEILRHNSRTALTFASADSEAELTVAPAAGTRAQLFRIEKVQEESGVADAVADTVPALHFDAATHMLHVSAQGTLHLYNLSGCLIMCRDVRPDASVGLSHLPAGVYVWSLNGVSGKILKTN